MKKKFLISAATLIVSIPTFAGGYLTNTNQHVSFLRNPARDASLSIDAVYSNPAGVAFLPEGFHLSLNIQSAYQTRTIESTCDLFAGFGGNTTKTYEGKASAPIIPSFQAAYVTDKWSISGSFAITGGGGKATFNNGLGSFEAQVAVLPSIMQSAGQSFVDQGILEQNPFAGTDKYSVDSYMQGRQYIYGAQLGGTYKINEHFSVFGGLRFNYVSNRYLGYIRNIQANVGGGNMVNLNTYLKEMGVKYAEQAALAQEMAAQAQMQGNTAAYQQYMKMAAIAQGVAGMANQYADKVADKELDCTQNGWGVTPILGVDFKTDKLNIGVKYEFNTRLNIENQTKIDDTGMFKNGVNTPNDIPALLTVGASYKVIPSLTVMAGYHHFFDTHARMADTQLADGSIVGKQKTLKRGTNEYLAGAEYNVNKWLLISAGFQKTSYGLSDEYMSDMSFVTSSYSIGLGAAFKLAKGLDLNIAYFWTNYQTYNKEYDKVLAISEDMPKFSVPFKDSFTRTNKVIGVGIDYHF